ncbi:MAG: acetyl-CoA carboxylase biotin carboxyl carrier protein [Lachnospiraceae bacterium]|nr:acetyl-CoA carboxylase biotin carboxyl carrier protein [Lachnospiraceae bacterium]
MKFEHLLELVNAVAKSGLTDFEYEEGDTRISMAREQKNSQNNRNAELTERNQMEAGEGFGGSVSDQQNYGTEGAILQSEEDGRKTSIKMFPSSKEAEASESGKVVASPLVGIFYTAPSEDAQVYVKIGDTVKKGQTLAIVEAMKLMNEIESDYDGVVEEILVKNGQGVEYGQPLFRIA